MEKIEIGGLATLTLGVKLFVFSALDHNSFIKPVHEAICLSPESIFPIRMHSNYH